MAEQRQTGSDVRATGSEKTEAKDAELLEGERAPADRDDPDEDTTTDGESSSAGESNSGWATVTAGSDDTGSSSANAIDIDAVDDSWLGSGEPAGAGPDEGQLPATEPADARVSTTATIDRSRAADSTQGDAVLTVDGVDPDLLDRRTVGEPSGEQLRDTSAKVDLESDVGRGALEDQAQLDRGRLGDADPSPADAGRADEAVGAEVTVGAAWDLGTDGGENDPADEPSTNDDAGFVADDVAGSVTDVYEPEPTNYAAPHEDGALGPTVDHTALDHVESSSPVHDHFDGI